MANWKKIIVSGSKAALIEVTASAAYPLNLSGITSSENTTPLVIDSEGNVTTGSEYAKKSGGDTVGGSNLLANFAIIGNGGSLIRTASSDDDNHANFNGAYIKNVNHISSSGNISGSVIGGSSLQIDTKEVINIDSSGKLILGHSSSETRITGSRLFISASGGITASVIPEIQKPPFFLGIKDTGEIIKINERSVGTSGGNGVAGLSSNDNNIDLNSDAVSSTTSQDLGVQVLINDGGTEIFLARNSKLLNSVVTPSVGDTIIIKTIPVTGGDIDEFTTTIKGIETESGIIPVGGLDAGEGSNPDDVLPLQMSLYPTAVAGTTNYAGFVSMSINNAWSGSTGDAAYDSLGSTVFLQTAGTEEGVVTLQLNTQSLSVGHITQSGNLLFSGSDGNTHTISYHQPDNGPHDILNISASNLAISGDAFVSGNLDIAGTLGFDGFFFSEGDVSRISGSNVFGSSSSNTHRFTGSVFMDSNLKLDGNTSILTAPSFSGDGSGLSNLDLADSNFKGISASSGILFKDNSGTLLSEYGGTTRTTASLKIKGVDSATNALEVDGDGLGVKALGITTALIANDAVDSTKLDHIFTSATNGIGVVGTFGSATNIPSITIDETGRITTASFFAISSTLTIGADVNPNDTVTIGTDTLNFEGGTGIETTVTNNNVKIDIKRGSSETFTNLQVTGILDLDGSVDADVSTFDIDATDLISLDTTDTSNGITIGTVTSGVPIKIGHTTSQTTIGDDLDVDGNLNVDGTSALVGNVTVTGNLTVNGLTTTINTTNLQVEDRFILLGSGSGTNAVAGATANFDTGIIFNSGSTEAGAGTALFFDMSEQRLAIATSVVDGQIATNAVGGDQAGDGDLAGNLVTVQTLGTAVQSVNILNESDEITTPITPAKFGEGEMIIDSNNDIWIYTE